MWTWSLLPVCRKPFPPLLMTPALQTHSTLETTFLYLVLPAQIFFASACHHVDAQTKQIIDKFKVFMHLTFASSQFGILRLHCTLMENGPNISQYFPSRLWMEGMDKGASALISDTCIHNCIFLSTLPTYIWFA